MTWQLGIAQGSRTKDREITGYLKLIKVVQEIVSVVEWCRQRNMEK